VFFPRWWTVVDGSIGLENAQGAFGAQAIAYPYVRCLNEAYSAVIRQLQLFNCVPSRLD